MRTSKPESEQNVKRKDVSHDIHLFNAPKYWRWTSDEEWNTTFVD